MVLLYHGVQMSPIASPWIRQTTHYGQYGVDLYFALSGWLIGHLYWRERIEFGNVLIGQFWLRRWVRTIPPYLVALLFFYLAVYVARHEPFDYGYLVFLQNYYERIPFFLVSWSLCVEEHFYLLLPLVFLIWRGVGNYRLTVALLLTILLMPPVFRFVQYPGNATDFGFAQTATHLRMEGLILSFLLSYIATEAPRDFQAIARTAPYVILISALSLSLLGLASGRLYYMLWPTIIALCLRRSCYSPSRATKSAVVLHGWCAQLRLQATPYISWIRWRCTWPRSPAKATSRHSTFQLPPRS
jgi:peptidoglycan/LPS O-acetylase OafA/YrhL